jgi:hypothetical protein
MVPKQLPGPASAARAWPAVVDQPLEHAPGQQAHVFGKEAEQALREEVRHLVGALLLVAVAPSPRRAGAGLRPGRQSLRAAASVMSRLVCRGLKLSGAVQMRRSSARLAGWSISAMRTSCVALGWPVNWVWMRIVSRSDTTRIGGLAQRQAVGEQLLERGVEVFARGLVLPRKHATHEDVGIARLAADDVAFFFKPVVLGTAGLGHTQQFAQVQKVALRALLFVQCVGWAGHATGRAPFGDEILKIYKLREALQKLGDTYDRIYIDTAPALNFYTRAALIGAAGCLIPFDCDSFSRQALYALMESVQEIRADHNPDLLVEGIVVNQFQARANLPQRMVAELIEEGLPVLQPYLPSSVKIRESHEQSLPMIYLDPNHKITLALVELHDGLRSE